MKAKGKLDRETVEAYSLRVVARDRGVPSLQSSVIVRVTVTDLNDNRPMFEKASYAVSVYENTNPKTKILTVRATDADAADNGKVGYRIKSGDTQVFSIDPTAGDIKTVKNLDRETTASYKLVVEAFDHGKNQLTATVDVSVTILDVNDNQPIIAPLNLKNVNESAAAGFSLGKISASDKDIGKNQELEYSLIEERGHDFFQIDAQSGEVTLKKRVDREAKDKHNLRFVVKDKGLPVLSAAADHVIQILDENDNAPKFGKASYSGKENCFCLLYTSPSPRDS